MIARVEPEDPKVTLSDRFHSQSRKIRIIHIGCGPSGLLLAFKARRFLNNYELVCYDKNPAIGGTWYETKYPGSACDVPAHSYVYTFEPNPEWSSFFAWAPEIKTYFENFYTKYKLEPHMRFNCHVKSATWIEEDGEYVVEIEKDGKIFTDRCNVLVNGTGIVNEWSYPNIKGLRSFKGILRHTADWDTSIDWTGKRVAVIGVGSSGVQVVPQVADGAKSLTVFARSLDWVAPLVKPEEGKIHESGIQPAGAGKHHYVEVEKQRLREDPEFFLAYRKRLENSMHSRFPMFVRDSDQCHRVKAKIESDMMSAIGDGHEELKSKCFPKWEPGCHRLSPAEGFLETLVLPHVTVKHAGVDEITEKGIIGPDGEELEFDIIICATGYKYTYSPHFKIVGTDGVTMDDEWNPQPNVYLSITGPKFPNYFVINGPTGNWSQGCALPSHELFLEYALQCCRKIQEENIRALEVKQAPTTAYLKHLKAWHDQHSIWSGDCRSWTKPGEVPYIWPGSLLHLMKTLRTPRFEHFDVQYRDGIWDLLGNGFTELEYAFALERPVDLAPYIRVNDDVPWTLDVPQEYRVDEKDQPDMITFVNAYDKRHVREKRVNKLMATE